MKHTTPAYRQMMNIWAAFSAMAVFGGLLLFSGSVRSQEQPGLRDRADEFYRRYEYAHAAKMYTRLVDVRKPRLRDLERLAACYRQMNQRESAESWYARVVEHEDSTPDHLLAYGRALKMNGRYAEAKSQLEKYIARAGNTGMVAIELAGCDSALNWMANPAPYRLRNESDVNTPASEFAVFPAGDVVFYVGEPATPAAKGIYGRTGNGFLEVYRAALSPAGTISNPVRYEADFNNVRYHVGPVIAATDGTQWYVTRTHTGKDGEQMRDSGRSYRTRNLELYIHRHVNGAWTEEPFAYNNPEAYSVGHAALSADRQLLYFVSDMPGGNGGTDIWYCELKDDGRWASPVNAGSVINSAGDELFPGIAEDGTLYYASDGFAGMGGLDIFRATGNKDEWNAPENMGYPVNSASDDFAYRIYRDETDSYRGFMASDRPGGKGGDDIYSFSYSKPRTVIVLTGSTSDRKTGRPLPDVSVTLADSEGGIVAGKRSDSTGWFEFQADPERTYTVLGRKNGYHADSVSVSTVGAPYPDTLKVALRLEPVLYVGLTFELKDIYYDFDRHDIRKDAASVLDELVRTLRDNPTLKIELASHTDSRGNNAYNEALSQRRAQAAVDYLVSRGIARERIVAKGYGESRLLNQCVDDVTCPEDLHQANRRTEVTVLEY